MLTYNLSKLYLSVVLILMVVMQEFKGYNDTKNNTFCIKDYWLKRLDTVSL